MRKSKQVLHPFTRALACAKLFSYNHTHTQCWHSLPPSVLRVFGCWCTYNTNSHSCGRQAVARAAIGNPLMCTCANINSIKMEMKQNLRINNIYRCTRQRHVIHKERSTKTQNWEYHDKSPINWRLIYILVRACVQKNENRLKRVCHSSGWRRRCRRSFCLRNAWIQRWFQLNANGIQRMPAIDLLLLILYIL